MLRLFRRNVVSDIMIQAVDFFVIKSIGNKKTLAIPIYLFKAIEVLHKKEYSFEQNRTST